MNYFVKHKQTGEVYIVGANTAVQAESLVVGTVPELAGRNYTVDEFIVQEEPHMEVGDVLALSELDDCTNDAMSKCLMDVGRNAGKLKQRIKRIKA